MSKPFLTYQQQIDKLVNEKKLLISDRTFAENALKQIGYFSLIGGYKRPFINPTTRIYESNTQFEDIYALYTFDKELRELVFKYLCEIEQRIRQLTSYAFCSIHGESQIAYLDPGSYKIGKAQPDELKKLIDTLDFHANRDTEHAYLVHQRKVHKNVPLWVLMNTLTFGQLSHFYSFLPFKIQSAVSKEFDYINEHELEIYLSALTWFRNICAHNERLYSFRLGRLDFPDKPLHKNLNISKKGSQYLNGKKDLFGLIIAMKYLLPEDSFAQLNDALKHLIHKYTKQSSRINKDKILSIMGFPPDWEKIA